MAARRGWPRDMVRDNGTNFVGGNNELRELVDQIDQAKVESLTSNQGINWHWNPPAYPRFGGVLERMIKAAKRAIKAILGKAEVNDEELETTIIGVESLINSRPLTQVSEDLNDDPVLTPNHFLIGKMWHLKVWIILSLTQKNDGDNEALERLGKKNLKLNECQYEAVKAVVVDRKDTIYILPTGYGKSLIYQLLPFVLLNLFISTHAQYG